MKYRDYIIRRVLFMILVLFGIAIVIFLLSRTLPGDPARLALGEYATEEQLQQFRKEWGLDKPLPIQFFIYMTGILRGDFGKSFKTYRYVLTDLIEFFPATFELVTVTMIFSIIISVPLGVISATKKGKWDHLSRLLALVGVAIPKYWSGLLLQFFLTAGILLAILPTTGRFGGGVTLPPHLTGLITIDSLITGNIPAFINGIKHLILPTITLSLAPIAQLTRIIRSSVMEELGKDYIIAAKARGLPESLIIYKYVLKNAFSSALTILGLTYGYALGGAFLVEYVFMWPGMAFYGVEAMLSKDLNAIAGVTLVIGLFFSIVNFIVDLLYGYLDPRIMRARAQ